MQLTVYMVFGGFKLKKSVTEILPVELVEIDEMVE